MGIGTHAPVALRCQLGELGHQPARVVEQLLGPVALHPALEEPDMVRVLRIDEQRHLVGAESALDLQAVDDLRPRPALGRAEHDHRPTRPRGVATVACIVMELVNLGDGLVQGGRHQLVHRFRVVTLHKVRRPAAAPQVLLQLLGLDPREHRRVGDLVAVQVQYRQHCPVGDRTQELVGVPRGRQRTRLGLAVTDDAGDDEIGIVERGPEGMAERVPEFATFVDRPRSRRCDVAGDPPGK